MAKIDTLDTPMMKQFREIKNQYPDAVLLFRCGDFYETYATSLLPIVVMERTKKAKR